MALIAHRFPAVMRALVAALLLATVAAPAMARQDRPLPALTIADATGVASGIVDVVADPAETITIPLRFASGGASAFDAVSWIANVTSAVNGGVLLSPPGTALEAPATWLDMPSGTVSLEPGRPVETTLTIRVPAGAEPGIHVAALVLEGVEPVPIPGSDAAQVIRSTALVAIQVPGEASASFELDEPTLVRHASGNVIQVGVRNTGAVPLSPGGTLTLRDATGAPFSESEVQMGAVFADTSTVLEASFNPVPPAGTYTLDLVLTDDDTGATASIADASIVVPAGLGETTPTAPAATEIPATPQPAREDAPAAADIQFADASVRADGDPILSVFVEARIANTGPPVGGARLVLVASRNGQVADEAVVAEQMALATGVTSISTRYAPEDGFAAGIWTFSLRLETVSDTGAATILAETGTVAKIDLS